MARKYAENTVVPMERSTAEIERLLAAHGGTHFGMMKYPDRIELGFINNGLRMRIVVDTPNIDDADRRRRENNRRFRALLLVVKAKLIGIEDGIVTFEDEFLPYIVMADGETIGMCLRKQLPEIAVGKSVPLLGMA